MNDRNKYSLAMHAGDARQWTPRQMLERVLHAWESGQANSDKAVLVFYDQDGQVHFYQAGMTLREAVSLLEIQKHSIINEYILDK